MKVFLIKLSIFVLSLFIILTVFNHYGKVIAGKIFPSIEQQFDIQYRNVLTKNFETLILGNSRMQNGINPDLLSKTAFNFAYGDSYDLIYSKIKFLEKERGITFKYIIMGTDYFQFSYIPGVSNPFKDYLSKMKFIRTRNLKNLQINFQQILMKNSIFI